MSPSLSLMTRELEKFMDTARQQGERRTQSGDKVLQELKKTRRRETSGRRSY